MQSATQSLKSEINLQIFTNEPIFILPFVVTNSRQLRLLRAGRIPSSPLIMVACGEAM
jgi:hypothetical protein